MFGIIFRYLIYVFLDKFPRFPSCPWYIVSISQVLLLNVCSATSSIGAAVAVAFFELFSGNAIVLAIVGALYSIPCFYYIVAVPQYSSPARFNLLTYNLICLYWWALRVLCEPEVMTDTVSFSYNLRQKDLSVFRIALHRSLAVTSGVIFAAFLCRAVWPTEARKELSKGLGELSSLLGRSCGFQVLIHCALDSA